MKSITNIIGILLIIGGILVLSYQGFTYTKKEKVAQLGQLEITADTEKTVAFPPLLGGLSLAAGIALLVIGRINKK